MRSTPLADATSYDCERPGNVKRPRKAVAFRLDKTGSLVRMPNFVQCDCSQCQAMVFSSVTDDQCSAKRKPTPSWEGSRDQSDVLTLTDVTTRPPMYDAGGAERLGVGVSCPSEASPQAVWVSCPLEASPQDAFFFGKHIYRLRTPLTANDPELVHRPRAGPTPRGAKRITVQRRAWVLCRRIYQSAGSHYGPEALVRILLWAGFCLGLPELLSNHEVLYEDPS